MNIYTIWHSTREYKEFLELLQENKSQTLVDVRSFPGSRKFPRFDQENLVSELPKSNIGYVYISPLWGRRKWTKNSHNTLWRNVSFRNYADYMETPEFLHGIEELEIIAKQSRVAIMCAEAVWRRCHRSMISDYLKWQWRDVQHIMWHGKTSEHPYTQPAHIVDGQLSYRDDDRLLDI